MSPALPALLALLCAAPPHPRLAVVDLDAPPMMTGLSEELSQDVVAAAKRLRLKVIAPDALLDQLGDSAYRALQACAGDGRCVAHQLALVKADRAVVGKLGRDAKHYLVRLWLVDVRTGQVIAGVDRAIPIAAERLEADVDEALPRLLEGKAEKLGELQVQALAGARVRLDGRDAGLAPARVRLKPGVHEVELYKPGYLPATRSVRVDAGKSVTLAVELLAVPVAPVAPPRPALPPLPPESGAPVATVTALSVSVVSALAGTAFGVSASRLRNHLASRLDPFVWTGPVGQSAVADHRQVASEMLFALSGAALLTAGLLAWHSDAVKASPAVTPDGGGFELSANF